MSIEHARFMESRGQAWHYDPIAEQYKRSKQQPWRKYIEAFTLMELIGNPTGKSVIDIACGEGYYTRLLWRRGAAKVVGIDLSEHMIQLARDQEASGWESIISWGMQESRC